MARTAPVPNIPPIPGMCPSIAVLGGGAGSGGSGGNGAGSGDGNGPGDGSGNGDGASGDGRNGGQGCGDPVCPITGRVFVDIFDFGFTSPLPLRWIRSYSSRTSHLAGEFGYGWSFAYGWRLHEKRCEVVVIDDGARAHRFEGVPTQGEVVTNDLGWRLCREADRYRLVVADGTQYELVAFTDGVFRLVAVADAHGNRIQLERSEDGTLRSMVDAAGRPFRVTTDASRRLVAITVPLDATHQRWVNVAGYEYDGAGNLTAFTDPEGFTWRYEYEGHLLTAHRTPGGLTYHYCYDGGGSDAHCVESWGDHPDGGDPALDVQPPSRPQEGQDRRPFKGIQHIRLDYLSAERCTEVTDALGGVTRYFGDESARVIKVVDAAGGITTRTFDPITGALVEETMPDGTRRRIHREGRESRGYADDRGASPRVVFDGQWETIVDSATNQVTRRRIDGRGVQVEVLHADGTQEMVEPDARGLVAREINRLGVVIRYVHDAQGNLTEAHFPAGVERREYDYWGRVTAHVDLYGRRTTWSWDRRGNVVGKHYPDGSSIRIERDWYGSPTLIDDRGRIHRMMYGGIGWLMRHEAPGGRVWEYRYDPEGHVTRVRAPSGLEHRQTYDHAGRAIRSEDFEGVLREARWDSARRPTILIDPLVREARTYEADGTLASAETRSAKVELRRDRATRTIAADNGQVLIEQELDPMGQIVRDRQGKHETRVVWRGGLVAIMASDVGVPVSARHHPTGRASSITAGSVELRLHTPVRRDGMLCTWTEASDRSPTEVDQLGDHLVMYRRYGDSGKLTEVWLARGSILAAERNPLLSRHDARVLAWSEFTYDAHAHLVGEKHHDGVEIRYSLDAAGQVTNRARYERGNVTSDESFAYDLDGRVVVEGATLDAQRRPVSYLGERFEYDAVGRLVKRHTDAGPWTYGWNDFGELTSVVAPTHEVKLMYDARGRRVCKQVLRKREVVREVHYVWSNNVVLHEVDVTANTSRTYLRDEKAWEPRAHIDLVAGEQTGVFYMPHPSGVVQRAVDAGGNVVFTADIGLWGDARNPTGSVTVDVRYPNQFEDADVGLVYNFRRWYDPRIGHFVSQDPESIDGNCNLRDYAPNPLVFMDPTGLLGPGMGHPQPPRQQDGRPGGSSPAPRAPSASGGHVWGTPDGGRPPRPTPQDLGDRNSNYLLGPGHYATEGTENSVGHFVPGYAPCPPGWDPLRQSGWPRDLQQQVDNAGYTHGCHSCGTTDPGPNGHFVPDHQPTVSAQRAASRQGSPIPASQVRFYPHCQNCAGNQANAQSRMASQGDAVNAAHGRAQGLRNQQHQNPRSASMQSQSELDARTSHLGIQQSGGGAYDARRPVAPGPDDNVGDNRALNGLRYRSWR